MASKTERYSLLIRGIVQGVGFRPFVARLAGECGISGFVRNTTRGVVVEAQGERSQIDGFCDKLLTRPPVMAAILDVKKSIIDTVEELGFTIVTSESDPAASAIIPPDIGTCDACCSELFDPADRRHGYPFLNCTDCGPRYSIIASAPYDRVRTSMSGFAQCPECAAEYADPANRRYHAQPNACPVCGPRLQLLDREGGPVDADPLEAACKIIKGGGIVALLGLGGFHLVCEATDEAAVANLRERKKRPAKPLAVMVDSVETAKSLADFSPEGLRELISPRAPIILAPMRDDVGIASSVAPGQDSVGLFLPYTPLHHLLFRVGGFRTLVMTSGNRSDEPMIATVEEAREKLIGVADLFITHDRPILRRIDDSVTRDMGALGVRIFRRARGYAPAPLPLPDGVKSKRMTLTVGAELLNSFSMTVGENVFLGPHIGDLKNLETEELFRSSVAHFLDLLQTMPEVVVCDLHPDYRSSRFAEELELEGVELVRVQHHEAHGAGCMADNNFSGEGIVLALDGVGLGHDGSIWGGEILAGRPGSFRRTGRLAETPQPGGDRATREPWRMIGAHLRRSLGSAWTELELKAFAGTTAEERELLETMMERGINSPATSSCGRLFDAAAGLLGFSGPQLYSAQAPMELEALASTARIDNLRGEPAGIVREDVTGLLLDPAPILEELLETALRGTGRERGAYRFHAGLASLLVSGTEATRELTGLNDVFLTGGCMQNRLLSELLDAKLTARGFVVRHHRRVPSNDGGISYGQAAWLAMRESL